jgi:hypothetical protein
MLATESGTRCKNTSEKQPSLNNRDILNLEKDIENEM